MHMALLGQIRFCIFMDLNRVAAFILWPRKNLFLAILDLEPEILSKPVFRTQGTNQNTYDSFFLTHLERQPFNKQRVLPVEGGGNKSRTL